MDIDGSFPKCKASFIASFMNKKLLLFFVFLAIFKHKNYHGIEKCIMIHVSRYHFEVYKFKTT